MDGECSWKWIENGPNGQVLWAMAWSPVGDQLLSMSIFAAVMFNNLINYKGRFCLQNLYFFSDDTKLGEVAIQISRCVKCRSLSLALWCSCQNSCVRWEKVNNLLCHVVRLLEKNIWIKKSHGGQKEGVRKPQFIHSQTGYFKGKNTEPKAACITLGWGKRWKAGGKNAKERSGRRQVCSLEAAKENPHCQTPFPSPRPVPLEAPLQHLCDSGCRRPVCGW